MLALCGYLWALIQIWPRKPERWALGVFVAWLAPPTVMIWLTLMPMGHYMETWFFHGLFLPVLVLVLSDRAGPRLLGVVGVVSGLAAAYTFSNAIFPGLLAGLLLLLSRRTLWERALAVATLLGATGATWLLAAWPRLSSVHGRVFGGGPSAPLGIVERLSGAFERATSYLVITEGGSWVRRGMFSLLDPWAGDIPEATTYTLAGVCVLGAAYLLWHTLLLLHPRRRQTLDLAGRVLGAHGILLGLTLALFVVLAPQAEVAYLTPCYPVLLFGLAQGAASLLRGHWLFRLAGAAPVLALVALLGVGWVSSSEWAGRELDRPGVQRADYRLVQQVIEGAHSDPSQVGPRRWSPPEAAVFEELCNRAYPGNERFCGVVAWDAAIASDRHGLTMLDAGRFAAACSDAGGGRGPGCAQAAGSWGRGADPQGLSEDEVVARWCAPFEPSLRGDCLVGFYRFRTEMNGILGEPIHRAQELCAGGRFDPSSWQASACMEMTAHLLTGMPGLPASPGVRASGCLGWPAAWVGACEELARVRQAGPEEVSCEQVYLDRFAQQQPEQDSLIYQQCAHARLSSDRPLYVPCVIGVARALDGISCSWRGTPVRL